MSETQQAPAPRITEWSVTRRLIPWYPADGDRVLPLGRHVHHDSRNLWFRHQQTAGGNLASVLHARNAPILDQLNVGACTGNGQVGVMASDPNFAALPAAVRSAAALNEALALKIYSGAEVIDGSGPYPPNDDGSSGPSAAKAAMQLGLIAGYTHCLSLADVLDALQKQAVSIGINWYDSFDSPPPSGLLTISSGASVRGGHEPMLRGIDVEAKTVFGDNSWGPDWNIKGSFTMSWATLERLLSEQGDGTVSVPLGSPAPVPTPPAPTPPTPSPSPSGPDGALWTATEEWAKGHHVGSNERTAKALLGWGAAKGFS